MTSFGTRVFCAMMSTMGGAGLVVFADPANAVGNAAQPVAQSARPALVAVAPAGTTIRG